MGGSSSKASSKTSTSISDHRIAGENSVIAAGGSTLNFNDMSEEALTSALAFAGESFENTIGLVEQAFEAILAGQKGALDQIGKSTSDAFEQSATALASQRSEEFQGLKEMLSTVSVVAIIGAGIYFTARK
jgi:hypothetical protein